MEKIKQMRGISSQSANLSELVEGSETANLVKVTASVENNAMLKPAESARVFVVAQTEEERIKNLKKFHSSQPSTPRKGGPSRYPGLKPNDTR